MKHSARAGLLFSILCFLCVGLLSERAHAGLTLMPRKSIRVFAEPDADGEVIRTLERGDQVPLSPIKYKGGWRKIRVRIQGEVREAWVRSGELKGSLIEGGEEQSGALIGVYQRRLGVGLAFALSYMSQSARSFQSSTSSVEIGPSSGLANYFGLFLDVPIKDQLQIRAEFLMRSTYLTATTALNGADPQPILLKQSFLGVASFLKYYLSRSGIFWMGAGGEYSKATKVTLTYGSNIDIPSTDLPNFVLVQLATGADFNLARHFFVLPEVRAGVVLTTKPLMINVEGLLNIGYAF